jgi:MYXO-CTERM domain-containing protein
MGVLVTCAGQLALAAPTCKAPRVLIVLDKSSSMVTGMVGNETKWTVAKSALSTVLNAYQGSIEFGLMVFPSPNQCGPGTVKVPIGPNKASAILTELTSAPPQSGNYTPMAQSLDAAAKVQSLLDSAYANNVLLITDGWQWCDPYDAATRFLPVNSTANLTALGITTYVVGFGESVDALTLNKMAAAAKTTVSATCNPAQTDYTKADNCYYQANNTQQLLTALQKIAVLVGGEKCDNVDNDCNGLIDDKLSRSCSTACGTGAETCLAGIWTGCTAPQPSAEICDGKDNNCNGAIDEGCTCTAGDTRSCGVNKGQCKAGIQTCSGNIWGICAGEVTATPEDCDGVDNNCDGMIDENLSRACQTMCGPGIETCVGGKWGGCTAQQTSQEICDGLDNDCDGTVDGADAICASGGTCVNGSCQARDAGNGCDCEVAGPTRPLPVIFLLALGALLLATRSRRS